jgi:hypothetical protein
MVYKRLMNDSESSERYADSRVETKNYKNAMNFCSCGDDDEEMRMGSEMMNGERTSCAGVS